MTVLPTSPPNDVLKQLDDLQDEVAGLRVRIEGMRNEAPDLRRPERRRTVAPYQPERRSSGE
jgi:hypothetical protein